MKILDHFRKSTACHDAVQIMFGNIQEGKEVIEDQSNQVSTSPEIHRHFLSEHQRAEFWESECEVL